jgi:hypothetical protein
MIPYAARECFNVTHCTAWTLAQQLVSRVSNTWLNELRCHELARAVQQQMPPYDLAILDGHCGPIEHSWLCFSDGVIIDPYVPGRMPAVQLIDPIAATRLYRIGVYRTDINA